MNDNANPNGAVATLPDATAKNQQQWREYCAQLLTEADKLRWEVQFLRDQRRQLLDTFVPSRQKQYELDDAAILRNVGGEPTVQQLLAEMRKPQGNRGIS